MGRIKTTGIHIFSDVVCDSRALGKPMVNEVLTHRHSITAGARPA
jgi:hypothetical protein